jgi:hypothetical protein
MKNVHKVYMKNVHKVLIKSVKKLHQICQIITNGLTDKKNPSVCKCLINHIITQHFWKLSKYKNYMAKRKKKTHLLQVTLDLKRVSRYRIVFIFQNIFGNKKKYLEYRNEKLWMAKLLFNWKIRPKGAMHSGLALFTHSDKNVEN